MTIIGELSVLASRCWKMPALTENTHKYTHTKARKCARVRTTKCPSGASLSISSHDNVFFISTPVRSSVTHCVSPLTYCFKSTILRKDRSFISLHQEMLQQVTVRGKEIFGKTLPIGLASPAYRLILSNSAVVMTDSWLTPRAALRPQTPYLPEVASLPASCLFKATSPHLSISPVIFFTPCLHYYRHCCCCHKL